MEIITVNDKVKAVATCWKTQYYLPGEHWKYINPPSSAIRIYSQLLSLPSDATAAQVDAIIGNSSWTRITCDGCNRDVNMVACFDNDCICIQCLLDAVNAQVQYLKDFE